MQYHVVRLNHTDKTGIDKHTCYVIIQDSDCCMIRVNGDKWVSGCNYNREGLVRLNKGIICGTN